MEFLLNLTLSSSMDSDATSCLEQCPSDILNHITRYLKGPDIICLFLSGSKKLNLQLLNSGGVSRLSFNFTSPRFRIWIPFIYKFHFLEILELIGPYETVFKRLDIQRLPKSLKEISFQVTDEFGANAPLSDFLLINSIDADYKPSPIELKVDRIPSDMDFSSSNVERIDANTIKFQNDAKPFGELFPRLESLSLIGFTISPALLAKLPRKLSYLRFHGFFQKSIFEVHKLQGLEMLVLPPQLKSLQIDGHFVFSPIHIKLIPASLTSLKTDSTISASDFELFPTTLKNLDAICNTQGLFPLNANPDFLRSCIEILPSLPLCIKSFGIDSYIPDQSDMDKLIEALPTHLNRLDVRLPMSIGLPNLKNLDKLEYLTIFSRTCFADSDIKKLPKNLKLFSLESPTQLTPACIEFLPSTLTDLSIVTGTNNFDDTWLTTHEYPKNLIALNLTRNPTWKSFDKLPRNLIRVGLSRCKKIENQDIKDLPPRIRHLDLWGAGKITGACFGDLPQFLSLLSLGNAKDILDQHIIMLPRYLTYLSIYPSEHLTVHCLRDMPRTLKQLILPQIRLKVPKQNDIYNASKIQAIISELPQSIRWLELGSSIDPDLCNHLAKEYSTMEKVKLDSDERELWTTEPRTMRGKQKESACCTQ